LAEARYWRDMRRRKKTCSARAMRKARLGV
jgi:hypothetical protein